MSLSFTKRLRCRLAMWFGNRVCRVPMDVRSSYFISKKLPSLVRANPKHGRMKP